MTADQKDFMLILDQICQCDLILKIFEEMTSIPDAEHTSWPDDVGILAIEVYFPSIYVDQAKLETYDGVSKGKYTIGLGQKGMGFCGDREDTNSLGFTVVKNLLEKNSIDPRDIGRLEVGTESILDKSKSVKTVLMQLFEKSGNTNIEGVDTINACYGGTQALFNCLDWVESSAWDGRRAIVVCADIAVYPAGNARPSGGAGAVAMLIGPHAPLVVERGMRSVHSTHAYDFYKPDLNSEYPIVDGKLSINCYLGALDKCYQGYKAKAALCCRHQKKEKSASECSCKKISLEYFDYMVFHVPFSRMCQKSLARLMLNDFLAESELEGAEGGKYDALREFRNIDLELLSENPVQAKEVEKVSMKCSQKVFEQKTEPSLLISRNVGNMYTPSLYAALASVLVSKPSSELRGRRIGMFSYGSGLASAMFSLKVSNEESPRLVELFKNLSDLPAKLEARKEILPEKFVKVLEVREKTHHLNNYTPVDPVEDLATGTYFLVHVDEKYRKTYARKSINGLVDFDGNYLGQAENSTAPSCHLY